MTCCNDPKPTIQGQGSVKQPGGSQAMGEPATVGPTFMIESGADRVRQSVEPQERSAEIAS